MISRFALLALLILGTGLSWLFIWGPGRTDPVLRLGSTTSTQDSGLLDHLIPLYTAETGVKVVVLAKGTGAAIRDGLAGQVDALLVHNQTREEELVADGYASVRLPIMSKRAALWGAKKASRYRQRKRASSLMVI